MIACFDVQYNETNEQVAIGSIAAVVFENWEDAEPISIYKHRLNNIVPYQPGQFYLRELPCLLEIIQLIKEPLEYLIIDGFVHLSAHGKKGLGAYLFEAISNKTPVIGVAKNRFKKDDFGITIKRGKSEKPLFITSVGIENDKAANSIESMHGDFRIPTLLKLVDKIARENL